MIPDHTITERVQRAIRNKLNEATDAHNTHVADGPNGTTLVDGFINIADLATAAVDAIKQAVDEAGSPAVPPVAVTEQAPEPVPVQEPPKGEPIPPQPEDDDDDDDDDDEEPPAKDPEADEYKEVKKEQGRKTRRKLKARAEST